MQLPRSHQLAAELIWLDQTPSTNSALRELVEERADLVNRTVIATDNQTAGRGRLGREWFAPAGKTLAISVLLRRREHALPASWLPLIAGSAVRRGLASLLAATESTDLVLGVKWPNDVLARSGSEGTSRKISGILTEMLTDGSIIVGIGINLTLTERELPTETATSLTLLAANADAEIDAVLSTVLSELFALLDALAAGEVEYVRDTVTSDSSTLGTEVRAHMPNGLVIEGQAVRLADDGALVIEVGADGAEQVVAAGDIEHLR